MNQLGSWFRGNHALLMVICCLAPMIVLAAILVFNVPLSTVALFGVMLLCPLMHGFMMRGMGHGDQHGQAACHGGTQPSQTGGKTGAGLQVAGSKRQD